MKKIFLSFILLIFPFCLFSTSYKSNAIGQELSVIESLSGIGWEKSDEEGNTQLFLDGVLQSSKKQFPDGYEIEEGEKTERVFVDEEGRITRRIISDDIEREYNYFYDGSRLISYTYSENDTLIKKVDYIFTGSALASISGSNRAFFLSEYYAYEDEKGINIINSLSIEDESDVIERGEYETLDNGDLKEERDGKTYYYNSSGRLSSEIGDDYTISYFYTPDGSLEHIERSTGSKKEVDIYQGNAVAKTILYEGDEIKKEITTSLSGEKEEIRYISGLPRYRIVYDIDGKRIKEIVAL